jgi:hypothetical protein
VTGLQGLKLYMVYWSYAMYIARSSRQRIRKFFTTAAQSAHAHIHAYIHPNHGFAWLHPSHDVDLVKTTKSSIQSNTGPGLTSLEMPQPPSESVPSSSRACGLS